MVTGLLDGLRLPYTGSPTEAMFLTAHKLLAKERLCQAGLPTPKVARCYMSLPCCFAGPKPGANGIELVRHAENLDPVDTLGAIVIRDDAGHLQDRYDRPAKLLLHVIRKRHAEEPALRQDSKLDLSQPGLQGLLEGMPHRIANRQCASKHARRDDHGQQDGQICPPVEADAASDQPPQTHG